MRKGQDVKKKQKKEHHTTKLLKGIWGDALMDAGWMQVPRLLRRMRTQLGLTTQEYTILLDYVDYYSYSQSINPYRHLEEVSGLSIRALQNIFASLEKKKLIIREIIVDNKKRKMGIIFSLKPLVTKLHLLVKKTSPGVVQKTSPTVGEENFISNTQEELRKEETIQESSSISSIDTYRGKSFDDDTDDEVFSHRNYVISLYEKYTDNQWRVGDDEFYEAVKDVIPDIIEAAIIASVLRSKTKINSFAYCEGAMREFQENLPPGYLSYLRDKWSEWKGRGTTKEHDE